MIDVNAHDYLALPRQAIWVPKGLRLPLYLRLILIVLSANLILVIVWLALVSIPAPPQNPFLSYQHVFPGHPWNNALTKQFSCLQVALPSPDGLYDECIYRQQTGPFSQVSVIVWNRTIIFLNFSVRKNSLVSGDLLLWWRQSELVSDHSHILLKFPDWGLSALATISGGRYAHFAPVRHVVFTMRGIQVPATDYRTHHD